MYFTKRILALALAVLLVIPCAFAVSAVAEDEHTLGATAACSGHNLGTFSGVPACVNANDELHICENNFPDDNFRNYVSNGDFDVDGDGHFTVSEIEAVKEIRCEDSNIVSLQGIEFFGNLTILSCYRNKLTTLDVSNNAALAYLDCSANELTSLDVSNNAALAYLDCSANELTSLDVSNNAVLTYLDCFNNQLTSLYLTNNTALTYLDCGYNKLVILYTPNNYKLTYLNCIYNQLQAIGVRNISELVNLECSYNQLTMLDVTQNNKLETLCCYNNLLEELDVSKNTKLTGIACYSNMFKYYYDISKDGKTMDVTVTLKIHEHTYGDYVSNGDGTHTRHCTFDGCTDTETENCSGGSATCTRKAVCEICGEEYGELDANNHTGEEVWEQTETTHTKKWNCCGKLTVAEADHEFEDGVCTVCAYPCAHKDENTDHKCDICGETVSNHSDENHDHLCDICGKAITNHVDSNNDHVCDICGKAVTNHVDDDNNHVCDICGKAITNHVDENNNHVCDICGKTVSNHVDSNNDHVCDICGKAVSNHVDDNKDHVCDICGKAVSNHVDDDNNHVCDTCGKAISNHVDSNNDHVCDICGKAVSNHVDDDSNHVCDICGKAVSNHVDDNKDHVCDICGETISTHTGGTATCKDKAVCEICGEAYGELNPENHTGGTHIEHEKAATCTEKGYTGDTYCNGCNEKIADGSEIPTKPHTPGEKWVIENGKKVKKCTECGAIAETAPRMPGDVDGDGEITMLDCLYLKRYILGTFSGEIVLENADVDGNGRIDATDYLYLKRGYLGTFDLSKFA